MMMKDMKDTEIPPTEQPSGMGMISFDESALIAVEQRVVIGTERGTSIVELAEWERDGLCQKIRALQAPSAVVKALEKAAREAVEMLDDDVDNAVEAVVRLRNALAPFSENAAG